MKLVFMGTPDFACPSLSALLQSADMNVCAVYTQPDKPQGRKQILTPPPVKTLALEHGLPVFQPPSLKEESAQKRLQTLAPDLIVVVAYGKLLPKAVLNIPAYGCINIHASLLPRWRGAAPIQWSIIAGDKYAGVTSMQMAEGLDTGDILLQTSTPIGARETAGELFDRLSHMGGALLTDTLATLLDGTLQPRPQDDSQSCYARMLNKELAVIDWTKPARAVDCLIRGLNPWPIAETTLAGERLKIYAAAPCDGTGQPGEVLVSSPKQGLVVACGEGALRLEEVQLVGGKRMACGAFLLGHKIETGVILGKGDL